MKLVSYGLILLLLTTTSSISTSMSNKKASPSLCFKSIISFGDSIADTGNLVRLEASTNLPASAFPPYGRTFFHYPTGRYSDGRLIIDFIAESLGLPPVQPFIKGQHENFSSGGFENGVNFAVAGATALDARFFEEIGVDNLMTNVSLEVEFNWFKQFLATIPDGKEYLESSLILFGEIGGNDYNYPLLQGKSIEVAKSFALEIINKIGATIEEIISLGARTMIVPGNFPMGCLPVFLTEFRTSNMNVYDSKINCIKWLNEFSKYQNRLLQRELNRLQKLHPHVNIIYGDYYNAAMQFYLSPNEFGFTGGVLKACCGGGGLYNYNALFKCGENKVTNCCDDPSIFANWDGIHFTEVAYNIIAQALLEAAIYNNPHLSTICTSAATVGLEHRQPKLGTVPAPP